MNDAHVAHRMSAEVPGGPTAMGSRDLTELLPNLLHHGAMQIRDGHSVLCPSRLAELRQEHPQAGDPALDPVGRFLEIRRHEGVAVSEGSFG
jgi:hypothetical protein